MGDSASKVRMVFENASGSVRSGWLVLLFTGLIVFVGAAASVALTGSQLLPKFFEGTDLMLLRSTVPTLIAAAVGNVMCALAFREQTLLRTPKPLRRFFVGFALGAALLAVAVVVPVMAGQATLRLGRFPILSLLNRGLLELALMAVPAFGEELLLRGVVLSALRRGLGNVLAVVVTGSIFGLLHLFNPNSSWLAVANVALVGLLFGALVIRFDSLWVAIGLHWSWNFCEGFVFGQPVSGVETGISVFEAQSDLSKVFWSGGAFGPEQSGVVAIVLAVALLLTVFWPKKKVDT